MLAAAAVMSGCMFLPGKWEIKYISLLRLTATIKL